MASPYPDPNSRRSIQKRNGRKPGRPRTKPELPFEPTKEQRELVKIMAAYDVPPSRMCKVIRNPQTRRCIGPPTLETMFADELETGSMEMDAICMAQLGRRVREGNMTAIIWYSKNKWGWRDMVEQKRTTEFDVNIEISPEELADKLEEHGLPGFVFGADKPVLELPPADTEGNGDAGSTEDSGRGSD